MSFVSSYGVVREEQLGESTDSRRDFHGPRGEDIYRRDDRSISGTRARWRLRADPLVEGDARGVPFPVMSAPTADVVICGAGIAGVAAAYHLAVRRGVTDVVLVDERPPLSLTSDKSTECYRNWWPGPGDDMVALLHARRCGWFSGQQLGMYLLERAREKGVRLVEGRVERVEVAGGRVRGVTAATRGGARTFSTPRFVNAAGPFVQRVSRLIGVELPVFCERHAKVAFNDVLRVVPRAAPMMIWTDPVRLAWSIEEREELARSSAHARLLEEFPAGVHGRPEGAGESPVVLLIWTYDVEPVEPTFPLEFDPAYGEIVLRGMSRMLPALAAYR